jgi:DNA invertase Pin-like site-specific DNA recombinase
MTIAAYIRVSTTDQNTDAQRELAVQAGATKIFEEKASARSTECRPVLKECLNWLREGDLLVVPKVDRLARSMRDLLNILHRLEGEGVKVKFLDQPSLSTDTPHGKLTLQILGAVGEFERALLRDRQADGIAAAKKRGTHFGRPPKVTEEIREKIRAMKADGQPMKVIQDAVGLSRSACYKILQGRR